MSEHVLRGSLRQVRDLHGKPTAGLFSFTAGETGPRVNPLGAPRAVVVVDADCFDEDQRSWDEIERQNEALKHLVAKLEKLARLYEVGDQLGALELSRELDFEELGQ